MLKNRIFLNSLSSLIQVFISAILTFILYKYLYMILGVAKLGLWALIVSFNSFIGISGLGLQGSIVKFVSKYIAQQNNKKTIDIIQTSVITIMVLSVLGSVIAYPISVIVLRYVLDSNSYILALKILPLIFISFILGMISSVYTSILDGLNRIYIRNLICITLGIVIFIAIILIIPKYGLIGLCYIKIYENIILLITCIFFIKKYLREFPFLPKKWRKVIFKEIFGYSINFQVINLAIIFFDPITKLLLTKFGGISYVGFYEMANKIVLQGRLFIVAAYQTMVPSVATYKETEPEKIMSFYMTTYKLLVLICIPFFSLIIIMSPWISKFWIGYYNIKFIYLISLLSFAWLVNSVSISAYFTNLGTGHIKDNVIGHVLMGSTNVLFGISLGYFYYGIGTILASCIAIISGSLFQFLSFHYKNNILKSIIPKELFYIYTICFISAIIHLILFSFNFKNCSYFIFIHTTIIIVLSCFILFSMFNNIIFLNMYNSLKNNIKNNFN